MLSYKNLGDSRAVAKQKRSSQVELKKKLLKFVDCVQIYKLCKLQG